MSGVVIYHTCRWLRCCLCTRTSTLYVSRSRAHCAVWHVESFFRDRAFTFTMRRSLSTGRQMMDNVDRSYWSPQCIFLDESRCSFKMHFIRPRTLVEVASSILSDALLISHRQCLNSRDCVTGLFSSSSIVMLLLSGP